jgi:hypothetical protein
MNNSIKFRCKAQCPQYLHLSVGYIYKEDVPHSKQYSFSLSVFMVIRLAAHFYEKYIDSANLFFYKVLQLVPTKLIIGYWQSLHSLLVSCGSKSVV